MTNACMQWQLSLAAHLRCEFGIHSLLDPSLWLLLLHVKHHGCRG